VSDWKSYKKWVDAVNLGSDLSVKLTTYTTDNSRTDDVAAKGAALAEQDDAEAHRLVAEMKNAEAQGLVTVAYKEVKGHDWETARLNLDKAKDLNGRQTGLWMTYGYLAFQRGQMSEAIEDYQQELKFHPEQYGTYGSLAQAQINLGRSQEAKETFKNWAAAQPGNTTPTVRLVSLLCKDNEGAEAVSVAESAIALLPDDKKKDEGLHLALGRAQLKAGMKEQADTTLLALMQSTTDPAMMNNTAYDLSDAGLEFKAAETATRTALGKMEDESKTWTLDENPQTLAAKSRLIEMTWDTMGWILYREGRSQEAMSYIEAAWKSNQDAEEGLHLGELLEKTGEKNAALTVYELADATISGYDAMGLKKAPEEREIELEKRAEALRKAGAKSSVHDARKALQEQRTIALGAANGLAATVEYRILFSEGKVEKVKAIGIQPLKKEEDRVMTVKLAGSWPVGSQARLVRTGMSNCHSGVCEVVLEP
jgi:tetratricopeptide (TPR) repeat protein